MSESVSLELVPLGLIDGPMDGPRSSFGEEDLLELAASMKGATQLQPIVLRRVGSRFETVVGDRRRRAALLAGWSEIQAIIRSDFSGSLLAVRAHENLHRRDMSFSEECRLVRALFDDLGQDVDRVCSALNRGRGWVDDRLLSELWPDALRAAVDAGTLAIGAARELMRITVPEDRDFYVGHAVASGASVGLARSWRTAWELTRVRTDPAALGHNFPADQPPPIPAQLPCFFCFVGVVVDEIVHVRLCKVCAGLIAEHRPGPDPGIRPPAAGTFADDQVSKVAS